jgi:hypothetical protein
MSIKPISNKRTIALTALVQKTVDALQKHEAAFGLDYELLPHERKAATVTRTVPVEAIAIAGDIVAAAPERFVDFDAEHTRSAVDFEKSLDPLLVQLRSFYEHVDAAMLKRHAPVAQDTLSLYATMKALARLRSNAVVRERAQDLGKALKRRNPKRASAKSGGPPAEAPAKADATAPQAVAIAAPTTAAHTP